MRSPIVSVIAKSFGYAFATVASVFTGWKVSDSMWSPNLTQILSSVKSVQRNISQISDANDEITQKITKTNHNKRKIQKKTSGVNQKLTRHKKKSDRLKKDLSRQQEITQSLLEKLNDTPKKALEEFKDKLSIYISLSNNCYEDAKMVNFSDGVVKFTYSSENCKQASELTKYLFGYQDEILFIGV